MLSEAEQVAADREAEAASLQRHLAQLLGLAPAGSSGVAAASA